MIHKEFDFYNHNIKFFGQYWQTTSTNAVIILVHGMGEHSTRYADYMIPEYLKNGLSVIAYDQFGHGKLKVKEATIRVMKLFLIVLK